MCVLPTLLAVRWQRQLGGWPGEWKRGSSNQRECAGLFACTCVVCVQACIPVCASMRVCVTSPRWRRGGLQNSNFGAISRGSGVFAANGLSSTHTKNTLEPALQLPVSSGRRFCHGFLSVSIEAQQRLHSVGLHQSTPPFKPHPLGSLELAVGPYRPHGHQWLRRTVQSTWCALKAILRPRCPATTHPRAVWRGPGQPTHLTFCRPQKQDPGYRYDRGNHTSQNQLRIDSKRFGPIQDLYQWN